jgi:integrase
LDYNRRRGKRDDVKGTKQELAPGVWKLRVYAGRRPNGNPIQITKTVRVESKGTPKRGAGVRFADQELAKLVADVERGQIVEGSETVSTLLDLWLGHCELQGRSPTTLREYRRLARVEIRPVLGSIKLSKLTENHLDRLYASLAQRGLKPASIRRVHALLGASLRYAERKKMVTRNVARNADPPPVRTAPVTAPSPAEVQAMVQAAEGLDPMLAPILLLAALTGARRGELCGLRWSDVDWTDGTLAIKRSVYEVPGGGFGVKATKTHQGRRIGLDDLAIELLRRHRAAVLDRAGSLSLEVPDDAYMFSISPQGSEPIRPDVLTRFAGRAAKAAGVDIHLHALRHFSATQGIAAGFDPVTVAGRLGHADPSITLRIYAHALEQRDRDLAAALGRTLSLPSSDEDTTTTG